MKKSKLKILVSGMMAGDPYQGGATWAVLQYVLGLRRLGHDVWFVELVKDPARCADYFRRVTSEFGLTDRTMLNSTDEVRDVDLLLNISGMLTDEALLSRIPVRVYLDIDPGFNQLWHAVQGIDMRFAGHTHFVTIGLAIGEPECPVPTCGLPWITTLQPIVLEHWPVANEIIHDALTTIGNWRGYGSVDHAGIFYGQKAHSLRPFFALPTLTPEKFLLAMSIHPDEKKDLAALAANGWQLVDPRVAAGSPSGYRQFIQQSKAEFGIAKSGYVASRCGWFSDRSICYLASGRPVIAQDTGFSRFLPTGKGLFAFQTTEDVLGAIAAVNRDYQQHARAARAIAEEYFDSDRVLTQLLEKLGMKEVLKAMLGPIRQIKRRPCPYYSSYHIEELDVTLASGKQVPVIFKDMTLLEAARQVKPTFFFDPLREIEVYREVLASRALGTAMFYGAVTDQGRHWLFLEKVRGDLLWQVGDFAVWRAAARWLARLHRASASSARLLRYDRAYYRQWMERAVAFHPAIADVAPAYERAVERLLQLPATFIHGEFYASNVVIQGNRICPIDWEMAALGPGLIDLAALSGGEWTDEKRADLTRAYGGADPVALDACRLHLAVRWLGWSKDWTPPREHAQDWLQEARTLAGKL